MSLGALALPSGNVGFDGQGTAMVPVSSGENKVGTIELKSPLETFKDTFTSMQESLAAMVGLQTQEQKQQAFIDKKLLEQHEFERKMMNEKFVAEGRSGPEMPSNNDLEGLNTDDKTYGNFVEKTEGQATGIIEGIKEAFGKVSFGEKMMAIVLAGGFFIFSKYKDTLTKVLTPIVQFVMDTIDFLGPTGAFAAFLTGFILLKSGLAKKGIMKAGSLILSGIKKSAAAIDKQGGILKAMGNGFEKINRGASAVVGGLKKTGSFITKNLTKGFDALGNGVKAMNKGVGSAASKLGGGFSKLFGFIGKGFMMMKVGLLSMSSSLAPILAPLLPIIAIAAGIAAVFFSLKSGFDTFKESLDNGDSMLTAVLKGLGDAMLTLVTLPYVLIQKLVGFIAGLFGFDNFKEKLESFDIKEQIIKSFKSLMSGMGRIIKAIAKGAGAALAAALPGGKTPQEEFARAYAEVMQGGEGKASIEGTSDFQGDESKSEFNREKATFGDMTGVEDIQAGNEVGDASAAESFYANKRKDEKFDKDYMASLPKRMSKSSKEMYLEIKKRDMKNLDKKMEQAEVIKNADGSTSKSARTSGTYIIKNGNIQGDTINQSSTTQVTGDLDVNNTEFTQKMLNDAF